MNCALSGTAPLPPMVANGNPGNATALLIFTTNKGLNATDPHGDNFPFEANTTHEVTLVGLKIGTEAILEDECGPSGIQYRIGRPGRCFGKDPPPS